MNFLQGVTIKKEPNLCENEDNATENSHYNDDDDPGSRCGEIYVGNNAKKWTFICTFCDKSVREIEEFINHIKYAHVNLPPPLPVEPVVEAVPPRESIVENGNSMKNEVPSFNPLDKALNEYVDYNDFLDVNVQTVPEEILSDNKLQKRGPYSQHGSGHVRIKSEPDSEKEDLQPTRGLKARSTLLKGARSRTLPGTTMPVPVHLVTKQKKPRKSRSRQKQIKGPAYCQICKRTFQFHSLYRNHMVKHTSETPFQCTQCNKAFKSKQAIRYHMTTHQREKPFKCELCEAAFYYEVQFVSHMETHKSENSHPCEVCGKLNRTKFEKDIHMRTHTGDRPFGCEFCLKRFRLRHHLSNHLKLHLTYRCDYCRIQFSNDVSLKKPYACPDCQNQANSTAATEAVNVDDNESFDDEAKDVTFHPVRESDATKPQTCKICHKTYANKRGLGVHTSTKH